MSLTEHTYIGNVYDPTSLQRVVAAAARLLAPLTYDSLVCRGTSGLAVCAPLSLATGRPYGIVHKPGRHGAEGYQGCYNPGRYIIVDDFISSGATMRAIIEDRTLRGRLGEPVGILLHNDADDWKLWEGLPVYRVSL